MQWLILDILELYLCNYIHLFLVVGNKKKLATKASWQSFALQGRCNSNNRLNPSILQNRRNFWTKYAIFTFFEIFNTLNLWNIVYLTDPV